MPRNHRIGIKDTVHTKIERSTMKTYAVIDIKGTLIKKIKGTKILSQDNGATIAIYGETGIVAIIYAPNVICVSEES